LMDENILQTPSHPVGSSVCDEIANDLVNSVLHDFEPYDRSMLLAELSSVKGDLEIIKLELESYRQRNTEASKSQKSWAQPPSGRLEPETVENRSNVEQFEQNISSRNMKFPPSHDASALLKAEQGQAHQRSAATGSTTTKGTDRAKLEAAYEQIAQLNLQMAHLYTELTFARTGSYREPNPSAQKFKFEADLCKRSEQIGILVQDIRHLQADLEFHQQLLEDHKKEKIKMTDELEQITQNNTSLTEKHKELEAQLKHERVDRKYSKTTKPDDKIGEPANVSYDLQRERAAREKLEEKNTRLNERHQKSLLMLESQRHKIYLLEKEVQKMQRNRRRDVPSRQRGVANLPRLPHTARDHRD